MAEEPRKNIKVNGKDSRIIHDSEHSTIVAADEVGPGGAYHEYLIVPRCLNPNSLCRINFQNGGVADVGRNGLHNEDLLRVVIHRLQCFQAGPFACSANQFALEYIQHGLEALEQRTAERKARGVEGQSKL